MSRTYKSLPSFFTSLSPTVLTSLPFPCMCLSDNLRIEYCNDAFSSLLQLDMSSSDSIDLCAVMPELQEDGQNTQVKLKNTLHSAQKDTTCESNWLFKKSDGTSFIAQITFNAVVQGSSSYYICYVKFLENEVKLSSGSCIATELTKALLDTMPLVIHLWSKDLKLIDCSVAVLDLFKVQNKEEYVSNFLKFSPEYQPDGLSKELSKQYLQEAFEKGKCSFQWINLDNEGRSFPSEETLCRVVLEGEECVIGYTHDISAVTENILNLSHVEERMRAILDMTPMAINVWDDNFKMRDCNMESLKIFGYDTKDDFLDEYEKTMLGNQPDGTPTAELLHTGLVLAFEKGYHRFENIHMLSESGKDLLFEITFIRIVMRDEEMVITYLHDLREITNILDALKENEARVQTILDATPLGINVWSEDLKLLDCNQSVVKLFGFNDRDDYLKNRSNIIPTVQPNGEDTDAFAVRSIAQAFAEGEVVEEFLFFNKQGDEVPVEITLRRTELHGEKRVISYIRDLRELKAMLAEIRAVEQDLRTARDAAEQSAKAKSEFLANMSHEIRTPLNGVLGLLHLLGNTKLAKAQKDYVDKTIFSASNLLRIINDILDFSKIDAGKMEMENIPFTLSEICSELKLLFEPQADAKKLNLEFKKSDTVGTAMLGDPLRVKQIFFNLVGNAIKFTDEGTVVVSMSSTQDGNRMRCLFSVKDSGIGMSQTQCARLFTAFMQADTSFTRKYGGTGLGLVIARRIARLMHGDLWVESEEGKGSTFFFTAIFEMAADDFVKVKSAFDDDDLGDFDESVVDMLESDGVFETKTSAPCEALIVQGAEADEAPAGSVNLAERCAHILLVEDNTINQLIAEELLKSAGHSVDIANNGQEALQMLQNNLSEDVKYNLVFMDIQMPVMDGLTAVTKIREDARLKDFPVVAMSAHAMTGDKEISLEHGMNEHITKPISPEVLFATVQKWAKF